MGKAARGAVKRLKQAAPSREMAVVQSVHHPGKTYRVDANKYKLAREALLKLLPKRAPGMTQAEMMHAMRKALPLNVFPGTTSSWWMKTVQLDLEAKGLVLRDAGKPLRWRKT